MLSRLRNIPGVWRLCIALCAPIWLGVAFYYSMLEIEPDVPLLVVLVNKDYIDHRDLLVVYSSDTPEVNPVGFLGRVGDFIAHKGYQSASFDRATLISPPGTPSNVWDRARVEMGWTYDGRTRARQERQYWRAAFWLSTALAPFAAFWIVVLAGQWVRTGFSLARK